MHRLALIILIAVSTAASGGDAAAPLPPIPDIPYRKFVLPNGLTLIVHQDHKAPIAAVNIWYHVGSKNEKRGKTGFAHLFEHLMFNGSEHFNDDYFKALEKVGATELNGTTNPDRTNYFQDVPVSALDLALFMESDRMGHLLGALDQARLDEQRGVVQNEKRQGENQPYGVTRQLLTENTYPPNHPYSWTTIGSMEDLNAASLEDAREWFRTYYGPNNAVLVIAGDVEPEAVKAKVERWFGDIPPGPPVPRHRAWVAKMTGTHRQTVEDRVPQARLYMVWNVPEWGSRDAVLLDLAAGVLARGKTSRLHRRLVRDEQIALDVSAYVAEQEIGSQFMVVATARPGGDLAAIEKAIREEIGAIAGMEAPAAAELERVKMLERAGFIRGAERIGGFGGKSDILASNMVFAGDPAFYAKRFEIEGTAGPEDVRRAAAGWLADGVYILEVHPHPSLAASGGGADRSRLPDVPPPPAPRFPAAERGTLPNGLGLIVARREGVPVVGLDLIVDAGYSADGDAPGRASLTMAMLDEGTRSRRARDIAEGLDGVGASLSAGADLDSCRVSLSALRSALDPALEIFADVVLNPSFPPEGLERMRRQQIAAIGRMKSSPMAMASGVLPAILYGRGHPYAQPYGGAGTEDSLGRLRREDLAEFHGAWFAPNNATLVVVGDTTLADIRPRIERLFASWKPREAPAKGAARVPDAPRSAVYLIDRPGSRQSAIFAAGLAPPKANPDEPAIAVVEDLLGGSFTSRINMNLREDKHWTYGARTQLPDARGPRAHIVATQVQGDKTRESMAEIAKELAGIVGPRPITPEELAKAKASLTLSLPGRWETGRAVAGSLAEVVKFGLPTEYFDAYPAAVRSVTVEAANAAARRLVRPESVTWVVVGDAAAIEAGIRALGFGEVKRIDPDGRPAGQKKTAEF